MSRKTFNRILIAVFIVIIILSFYKLPYYVYRPGSATELEPLVKVEGNAEKAEGSFMLTTVSRLEPNIFIYLWARIRPFYEIQRQDDVREEGETQEEFDVQQLYLMDHSKYNAIHTAYEYAGIPVKNEYHGVYVVDIIGGMPAETILKPGDQIIKVDDLEFKSSDEFGSYVKDATDPITITFLRDGETRTAKIETAPFPENPEEHGFGIRLVDDYEVITDPPVEVNSGSIGGPSAGLMFSLEIYNQLTEEDWTKGYEIAGTGEITEDGRVLPIGGIEHKIVAADNKGVDIFFAPSMKVRGTSNYEEALKVKEQINTDLDIVPVETFEDAIRYLEKLEPEEKGE